MLLTPSFKKSLIVEQFQGNYLKQGIPEDVKLRRTTLTFVEAETVQN